MSYCIRCANFYNGSYSDYGGDSCDIKLDARAYDRVINHIGRKVYVEKQEYLDLLKANHNRSTLSEEDVRNCKLNSNMDCPYFRRKLTLWERIVLIFGGPK